MRALTRPFVSIVMPALNERSYIENALRSILPSDDGTDCELLVIDGGSTDGTQEIVERLQRENEHIRFVHNRRRIQSAAMNLAANICDPRSDYLVRADCHAKYPPDFVRRSVEKLIETKSASVVVPLISEGHTCLQRAIAAAQRSRLSNGGSDHRLVGRHGYVDHGHHAAFDRRSYLEVGGYDESFVYNEDAEFDQRLTASGRRIYLAGDLVVRYFPRKTFAALAQQYWNWGRGRAKNVLKHGSAMKVRQILPIIAMLGSLASLTLAFVSPWFLLPPAAYVATALVWGGVIAAVAKDPCQCLSGLAAVVMHVAWAAGFLYQIALGRKAGATGLPPAASPSRRG